MGLRRGGGSPGESRTPKEGEAETDYNFQGVMETSV